MHWKVVILLQQIFPPQKIFQCKRVICFFAEWNSFRWDSKENSVKRIRQNLKPRIHFPVLLFYPYFISYNISGSIVKNIFTKLNQTKIKVDKNFREQNVSVIRRKIKQIVLSDVSHYLYYFSLRDVSACEIMYFCFIGFTIQKEILIKKFWSYFRSMNSKFGYFRI